LTFEADPSYLLDPRAPLRASTLLSDAKIVVLLRDPVARAISHFNHNVRIGKEDATITEALDLESDRIEGEVERIWNDPEYRARNYLRYSYATRGKYVEQLDRWLEFFPSDQMLVVDSAELFRNTAVTYQNLLDFLGLPQWTPLTFPNASASSNGHEPPAVDTAVRDRLTGLFKPFNERLYQVIGRDFGW
jgi:hypothetical protein